MSSRIDVTTLCVTPNERRVLDVVRRRANVTRAEVTQDTELTAQSISRIVDALILLGLLRRGDKAIQGRGQPSFQLHLNASAAYSVGLSIMTDAISGSVMNFAGEVIASDWSHLEAYDLDTILRSCRSLYDRLLISTRLSTFQIAGVGVGVTGYFVGRGRQVNPPYPLDALALVDIDRLLVKALERPVWIDNDGNVAATGEALNGAGKRMPTFGYVFFAMGIGGAVVINGSVFPGAFGNAGEFAGILPPELQQERPSLELLRLTMAKHGHAYRDIYEMIRHFDLSHPGVAEWIAIAAPKLSAIASAIAAVIDPEAIVLGGRIPKSLATRLTEAIQFYNVPRRGISRPIPKIIVSEVEGDAAAIGAASMPLKSRFFC